MIIKKFKRLDSNYKRAIILLLVTIVLIGIVMIKAHAVFSAGLVYLIISITAILFYLTWKYLDKVIEIILVGVMIFMLWIMVNLQQFFNISMLTITAINLFLLYTFIKEK